VRNVGCYPALVVCTFRDRTNSWGQVCSDVYIAFAFDVSQLYCIELIL